MSNTANLIMSGESNRGLVRERNEDSFFYALDEDGNAAIAVVADGIGGHRDGDIASFVCCSELLIAWRNRMIREMTVEGARDFLCDEIQRINISLFICNRRDRNTQPMGSTVVAAIFMPDKVVVAHAGDSRLYSADQAGGKLLTEDHTLLSQMQKNHAPVTHDPVLLNNVISRAVGPRLSLDLEINVYDRRPETRYMLCSDGLSRYTEPEKVEQTLRNAETPRMAVDSLMRTALIGGGRDNITIICAFPANERR
ncbi:MAG: PP2C family serine/threonine-protein phosphatase [Victivallaceae bacterium]